MIAIFSSIQSSLDYFEIKISSVVKNIATFSDLSFQIAQVKDCDDPSAFQKLKVKNEFSSPQERFCAQIMRYFFSSSHDKTPFLKSTATVNIHFIFTLFKSKSVKRVNNYKNG